jgi:hypothetical protein
MEIKKAWYDFSGRADNKIICETVDQKMVEFNIVPFRPITASDCVPYHGRLTKSLSVPQYILWCYKLNLT